MYFKGWTFIFSEDPPENHLMVIGGLPLKYYVLLFYYYDVSFSCVCPVIDDEFRHNIVKVAVDPRGNSRVDPQTTLTMLWRNSLSITGDVWKFDVNLFFTITDCQIVRFRSLMHCINCKFMCLSAYWQLKLANERATISVVIVKLQSDRNFRRFGEKW